MTIQHPTIDKVVRGARFWHLKTAHWVGLCNCAGVPDYMKVGWAKYHLTEYSLTEPKPEAPNAQVPV